MIRKVNKEDLDELNTMYNELIKDEQINYNELINKEYNVKNIYNEAYLKDDRIILVFEDNNIIKGFIYGIKMKSKLYAKEIVKLDALYVKKEYRNKGIGNSLIKEFICWVKDNKVEYILVSVLSNNKAAKKLYEKYNFLTYKEIMMNKVI